MNSILSDFYDCQKRIASIQEEIDQLNKERASINESEEQIERLIQSAYHSIDRLFAQWGNCEDINSLQQYIDNASKQMRYEFNARIERVEEKTSLKMKQLLEQQESFMEIKKELNINKQSWE